jgi:surface protein
MRSPITSVIHVVLLDLLILLIASSPQVHAAQCFDANNELKDAADRYVAGTWSTADNDTYGPIEGWCFTDQVTSMKELFKGASTFNADINAWDTSSITDMESMFQGAAQFNAAISNWDTSSVTTMKTCSQQQPCLIRILQGGQHP